MAANSLKVTVLSTKVPREPIPITENECEIYFFRAKHGIWSALRASISLPSAASPILIYQPPHPWGASNGPVQLVRGPQIWVSSRRSSLTQPFVESCVDFEVAHLSVVMVWRLPYPEIPTLSACAQALVLAVRNYSIPELLQTHTHTHTHTHIAMYPISDSTPLHHD